MNRLTNQDSIILCTLPSSYNGYYVWFALTFGCHTEAAAVIGIRGGLGDRRRPPDAP